METVKFYRWTLIETFQRPDLVGTLRPWAKAICDCGQVRELRLYPLTHGKTQSCGCLAREQKAERYKAHGLPHDYRRLPEYDIWAAMKQRCRNPNNKHFANYGGRGITLCSQWEKFAQFYKDVGPRPSTAHTIERHDNNGGYSPENASWQTRKQNNRNKRNHRYLTHNGKTQCLNAWAEELNIPRERIKTRLSRGWSIHDALTKERRNNQHG